MLDDDTDQKSVLLLITNRSKIRQHWGKTDKEVTDIIEDIKKWIQTQNFPEMPSDSMVEFFLTNCKYRVETTKGNITSYYGIRKRIPELYKGSHPRSKKMEESWDMGVYIPLPHLLDDAYRICINKLFPYSGNFKCSSHFANALNVYEVRICEDLYVSEILIVDYEHLSWNHIIRISPFILHKMIINFEEVAKSRLKKIHIINAPSYVHILLNTIKRFLKKKIADRFVIHQSIDCLYEYIPKELLPIDYGGQQQSIKELIDLWKKKVDGYHERFTMFEQLEVET